MKRIASMMVLVAALLAIGKFCPLAPHWRHVVADEGDEGSGDDGGDDGDDSGT